VQQKNTLIQVSTFFKTFAGLFAVPALERNDTRIRIGANVAILVCNLVGSGTLIGAAFQPNDELRKTAQRIRWTEREEEGQMREKYED
jgi:hypothetical protein